MTRIINLFKMFLQRNKTVYACINTFKTEKQEGNIKKDTL
ncbi:hypothetical protein WCP94_001037 [Bilophila wadsworthia]